MVSFSRMKLPAALANILQEWFVKHVKEFKVLTWSPNSPDLNPIEHPRDVREKQGEAPACDLHVNVLLLTSWCPKSLQRFRAVLAVQGEPTQYEAGDFNVVTDRCKFKSFVIFSPPVYHTMNIMEKKNHFQLRN